MYCKWFHDTSWDSKTIGKNAARIFTALAFGASQINATYGFLWCGFMLGFVVFGLGLVWTNAMIADDSIIGPAIFHAGYDLLVIFPILNSL
jgi:membrane protease YdiL (CAAX protease family)